MGAVESDSAVKLYGSGEFSSAREATQWLIKQQEVVSKL